MSSDRSRRSAFAASMLVQCRNRAQAGLTGDGRRQSASTRRAAHANSADAARRADEMPRPP
jgi:hypothetical protein